MPVSDNFTRFRMTWLDQIWADKELTATTRDIAMRISSRFNRKRYIESGACSAWPSYDTLANEAGVSSKTVQRAVMLLRKSGHLLTKGAGGRHCSLTYYAIIKGEKSTEDGRFDAEKRGHLCPPLDVTRDNRDGKVDISVPKGGHLKPQKVDTHVLQTSLNKIPNEILEDAREPVEASPARSPVGVIVLSLLAGGPAKLPPLPPFMRGREELYPDLVMDHQATHGWPDLYQRCKDPSLQSEALARLALEMEPVACDGELWLAWKAEYRRRGWPMPVPLDGLACFPEGGPTNLDAFLSEIQRSLIDRAVAGSKNVVRIGAVR
jgi:hypothetical protein